MKAIMLLPSPLTPPDSPLLVPILEAEEDIMEQLLYHDAHLHGIHTADTAKYAYSILPCKVISPAPLYIPETIHMAKPIVGDRVGIPPAPPPSPILTPLTSRPCCPMYEEDSTLGPWDPPSLPDSLKESPQLPFPLFEEDPSSFIDSYCSSFEDDSWDEYEEPFPSSTRDSYSRMSMDTLTYSLYDEEPIPLAAVPTLEEPPTSLLEDSLLSSPSSLKRNASFDTGFTSQRALPPADYLSGRSSSSSSLFSDWDACVGEPQLQGKKPEWYRSLGSRRGKKQPSLIRSATSPEPSDTSSSRATSIRQQKAEKFLGPLDKLFGGRSKKL